jgi:hypothetical protein
MRICVGTLYSGEREFDQCRASIRRQTHAAADHFVVRNLPNREAHQALYRGFEKRSESNDLFVKIDADMVIRRDGFFADLVAWFQDHPGIDELEIAVQDFFTDRMIFGLHAFRSHVRWPVIDEALFVDQSPVPASRRCQSYEALAPAADHCPDPSPFQAFHYGVHKALKILQPDREESSRPYRVFHWDLLRAVEEHRRRVPDPRLDLVLLGAELAFTGRFAPHHLDYHDPELRRFLESLGGLSDDRISREVARHRRRNWGWLPHPVRREVLAATRGSQTLSCSLREFVHWSRRRLGS